MKKTLLPSRIKYDNAHPTISVRVTQDEYIELYALCQKTGKTLREIMLEALKKQKPNAKYAYSQGYEQGKKDNQVWYFCGKCGERIDIAPNSNSHKALITYMKEHGWGHQACHEKA